MSRLIELDAAIAETWKDTGYSDPLNVMTAIRDRLEALPPVDAVPVVRCKDCKHYQFADNRAFGFPVKRCEWTGFEDVDDEDYCSRGERKGGEHDRG